MIYIFFNLYIFCSFIFIAAAIHWLAGFKSSDCFYTPLPLYHTAGGCMSTGQMLLYGATLVIRKKFSASAYFSECSKYNCTVSFHCVTPIKYINQYQTCSELRDI